MSETLPNLRECRNQPSKPKRDDRRARSKRAAVGPPRTAPTLYEGCGRAYLGELEGANIIKIHRRSGKLSYLAYPDFDSDPHPALVRCVRLNLRTRQIECYDYAESRSKKGTVPLGEMDSPIFHNPPILHRKETFLLPKHELYAKFARLTAQEEKHGLLDDPSDIGTRAGWEARLRQAGFALHGHRLVRHSVISEFVRRTLSIEP